MEKEKDSPNSVPASVMVLGVVAAQGMVARLYH